MKYSMKNSCAGILWGVLLLNGLMSFSLAYTATNCTFSGIYSFGDSLTDNGNSISAYPDQFIDSEVAPNGFEFPHHAADRWCDGRLLVDYIAFGIRGKPNYAILRSIASDFSYGANFAVAGATARNITRWVPNSGFTTPFSLNLQVSWLQRYKVRLDFYYSQAFVTQDLPAIDSLNTSLYMVYAGFQDYFFPLYDQTITPRHAVRMVPSVVDAIISAVEGIYKFGAKSILVVNLLPLGCTPALLSLKTEAAHRYDHHGCLRGANKVSKMHNTLLGHKVAALRKKYTDATFYYGDLHGVYTDVLKNTTYYGITNPLSACCGYGGKYNFNKKVTCGHAGTVDGVSLNLTIPCAEPTTHASWDGIHTSERFNRAVATAFFTGKHITPKGGFRCIPDFSNWFN